MIIQRSVFSKRNMFGAVIFVALIGYLSFAYITTTNTVSTNSRADETVKVPQVNPLSKPPTEEQQTEENLYQVSRLNDGTIELFNKPEQNLPENQIYSIYMNRGEEWIYLDTFIGTKENLKIKFSEFWIPNNPVSAEDAQNSLFYLFPQN